MTAVEQPLRLLRLLPSAQPDSVWLTASAVRAPSSNAEADSLDVSHQAALRPIRDFHGPAELFSDEPSSPLTASTSSSLFSNCTSEPHLSRLLAEESCCQPEGYLLRSPPGLEHKPVLLGPDKEREPKDVR